MSRSRCRKPRRNAGASAKDAGRARDVMVARWQISAMRFARKIVGATRASIPDDELESAAMWGLLCAIDKFDPEKGARFGTYLYHKVRSAVYEYIRDATHRADRSRVRFYSLEQLDERSRMGWHHIQSDRVVDFRSYLLQVGLSGSSDSAALRLMEAPEPSSAAERHERAELAELAMRALRNHPRLRRVVRLYFYESKTLREVGTRMSFSEQRAMQLVHKAIHMMRQDLDARGVSSEDVA